MNPKSHIVCPIAPLLHQLVLDRRGSAAIQFGLVIPILMLVIFGALELSRVVFTKTSIEHAVSETVRYASVRGAASETPATVTELQAYASDFSGLDPDAAATAITWSPDNFPGSTVTVAMNYTYTPLTLYVFGADFTLSAFASRTIVR